MNAPPRKKSAPAAATAAAIVRVWASDSMAQGTAMIATQRRPLDLIARAAKFVMPPLVDRRLRRDRALWRAMHAEAMLRLHNRRDVLIYIVAMTAVAAVSGLALASLYSLPQFSAAMQWSTFASCALLGVAVHVAIHRWRLRPYLREAFRARGI